MPLLSSSKSGRGPAGCALSTVILLTLSASVGTYFLGSVLAPGSGTLLGTSLKSSSHGNWDTECDQPRPPVLDLMRDFMECMLHPHFVLGGVEGGCEMLEAEGMPSDALVKAERLHIKHSACMPLLEEVWGPQDRPRVASNESFMMHSVVLRPNSDDAKIVTQVFCGDRFSFLPHLARYIRLDRPTSVLDAGAGIGVGTLLLAALTRFKGDVVALEPVPPSYQVAKENLAGVSQVVQLESAAIGVELEEREAMMAGVSGQMSSFRVVESEEDLKAADEAHEVRTTKLYSLQGHVRPAKFDFVKLDLEGAEAVEFSNPLSREVFCEARCLIVDIHEAVKPGAEAAVMGFVASSECRAGRRFRRLPTEGAYHVFCRSDLVGASDVALLAPEVEPPPETSLQVVRSMFLSGGLPKLPETYAPWQPAWRNSVAMCLTMRQENSTDVREWLMYHRWLGVEHVYLVDNAQRGESPIGAQLQDFVNEGFLTYILDPSPGLMLLARLRCLQLGREKFNWMGFPDMDEFFILRDPKMKLPELLNEYRSHAGLSVHWVTVGSGGRERRPVAGGVLRHYDHCILNPKGQVKLIANLYFVQSPVCHAHSMKFWGDASPVNEARVPIGYEEHNCVIQEEDGRDPAEFMACQTCPGSRVDVGRGYRPTVDKIALYHFLTRSREDFLIKSARAQPGIIGKGKPISYYDMMTKKTNQTSPLCDIPAERARSTSCCPEEDYVLRPAKIQFL